MERNKPITTGSPLDTASTTPPNTMDSSLSGAMLTKTYQIAQTLNIQEEDVLMFYGAGAQKKISDFSDEVLKSVRMNDSTEVSDMLMYLIEKIKDFDAVTEKPKGLRALFSTPQKQAKFISQKYSALETTIGEIAKKLEWHQVHLLKDISLLNRFFDLNAEYFQELTMYIVAGEDALERTKMQKEREEQKIPTEKLSLIELHNRENFVQVCDRFERKLHDLRLTRQISLQMAPQIRMLQNNNSMLVERIQSTIVNTLPLWKNQIVLAIGMHNTNQALRAQRAMTNATNEMLVNNASRLKDGTVATAKEMQRGIVDVNTLVQTNQMLIDTINEVVDIQKQGRSSRMEAEQTLAEIEGTLKKKIQS